MEALERSQVVAVEENSEPLDDGVITIYKDEEIW